jgi:hypothetical protein
MFGGFTEGLQLFASFAMLMNFPRFNKMKGMGQIVSWSVRDESLHCEGIIKLFHTFCRGTRCLTSRGEGRHDRVCQKTVRLEDAFIDLAFEMGPVRHDAKEIKRYIRYIADWRLKQLGLQPIYMIEEHPLPWLRRCSTAWSTPTSSKPARPNIRRPRPGNWNWWEGVIGFDCEGLQIFLPLSRKVCLYLFDPVAYGSAANTLSRVLGLEDLLKVNALSILNSSYNLYGHTTSDLEVAAVLRELTRLYEDFPRVAFVETESYDTGEDKTASLIAHYHVQIPANFAFRFARSRQTVPREGLRSDRLAGERRKAVGSSSTARTLRVVESTISKPRALLENLPVERLARTLRTSMRHGQLRRAAPQHNSGGSHSGDTIPVNQSADTSRDHRQTRARLNPAAAEARGLASCAESRLLSRFR